MIPEHKCFYTVIVSLLISNILSYYIKLAPITSNLVLPLIIFLIITLFSNSYQEPFSSNQPNNYQPNNNQLNNNQLNNNQPNNNQPNNNQPMNKIGSINREVDKKEKKTYVMEDMTGLDETDETDTVTVTELFTRNNTVKIYENAATINY